MQKIKRQYRSLGSKFNYIKITSGQKFIDYLGPTIFNSIDFDVKQKLLLHIQKFFFKKME